MKQIRKYKYLITLILAIFTLIITIMIKKELINKKYNGIVTNNDELTIKENIKKNVIQESTCTVDIKGEVTFPGAYLLDCNKKVIDVIKEAGGLTDNADTSLTNLAKTIKDEMVIIIYSKEEVSKLKANETEKEVVCPECICPKITSDSDIDNSVDNKKDNKLININTASINELMTIPGIGESKAKAIIEYRNNNGSFKTIEDIQNVTGIGAKLYEQIKIYITT